MNSRSSDLQEWTRAGWLSAFGLVMLLQIGIILLLSNRPPLAPPPDVSFTLRIVPSTPAASAIAGLFALEDPTLFALPDVRGFSGAAWLNVPPLKHSAVEWTEPVPWLGQSGEALGGAFRQFARTNVPGPRLLADKPPPPISEVNVPPVPVRSRSMLHIEGDLVNRGPLAPVAVPSIEHTNLLTNTVLRVRVDPGGRVFSPPILWSGSGLKEADDLAINILRSIRFTPVSDGNPTAPVSSSTLAFGNVVFEWHVVEKTATDTNAAVVVPIP